MDLKEDTARNIDRLVTVFAGLGDDRTFLVQLYEAASKLLDGAPVSLFAAERLIDNVKAGDNVFIVCDFTALPNFPFGESDGPPGAASLARAIRLGLNALPIVIAGSMGLHSLRRTVRAAGLNILGHREAKEMTTAVATEVVFPCVAKEESKKIASTMIEEYEPKAVISVETVGPNRKGVKHNENGYDIEVGGILPRLECLFDEASARNILSIGCIDLGNEIGSGALEATVRRVTQYGDVCRCPCGSGIACTVGTDIVFPASISNWAAYAITAMIGYLLDKPQILQDEDTERLMLEACIMAGAYDTEIGELVTAADGVRLKGQQGLVNLLHSIVENGLARNQKNETER